MEEEEQQDGASPDYHFPEPEGGGGVLGAVADIAELANAGGEVIPLVGSITNGALSLANSGAAAWDTYQAKKAYDAGDGVTGAAEMGAADMRMNNATGHLINMIPLVGTARALM